MEKIYCKILKPLKVKLQNGRDLQLRSGQHWNFPESQANELLRKGFVEIVIDTEPEMPIVKKAKQKKTTEIIEDLDNSLSES